MPTNITLNIAKGATITIPAGDSLILGASYLTGIDSVIINNRGTLQASDNGIKIFTDIENQNGTILTPLSIDVGLVWDFNYNNYGTGILKIGDATWDQNFVYKTVHEEPDIGIQLLSDNDTIRFNSKPNNGVIVTTTGPDHNSPFSVNIQNDVKDNQYEVCNSITVQNDGKIVVGGSTKTGTGSTPSLFFLIRYDTDGTLDRSFGTNGKVTTEITNSYGDDICHSVSIFNNGKIIAVGTSNGKLAIAYYNTDGSLDTSVNNTGNNSGKVYDALLNGKWHASAIYNDRKFIVAGYTMVSSNFIFTVARYNNDRTLDRTFGTGLVTTNFGGTKEFANSIVVQKDGKIIVAGRGKINNNYNFILARYNDDGLLDTTFGTAGIIITAVVNNINSKCNSIALQSDSSIIAGGIVDDGVDYKFALVKYTKNGNIATGFGTNGIIITSIYSGTNTIQCSSIGIQDNNHIIVGGTSYNGSDRDFILVSYNQHGAINSSFGTNGKLITTINSDEEINDIAILDNNQIIAGGYTEDGSDRDVAIVRYHTDGTIDNTFSTGGLKINTYNISEYSHIKIEGVLFSPLDIFNVKNKNFLRLPKANRHLLLRNPNKFFLDNDKLKDLYNSLAMGDPYIYPMKSKIPVKLPDKYANYRLYEYGNTFINVEVTKATEEHTQRMVNFVNNLGHNTNDVIADGYFFNKIFIADGDNKMIIDLKTKHVKLHKDCNKKFFYLQKYNGIAGNKDWNGKSENIVILWISSQGRMVKATIHFFENPHIENGISLNVINMSNSAIGLCVNNYKPELMEIPDLYKLKYDIIKHKLERIKNPFQNISIKLDNEKWIQKTLL